MPKQNKSQGRDSAAEDARKLAQQIEDELDAKREMAKLEEWKQSNRDDPGMEHA
jgi:predicted unusual protein kinase regulating ubiquinone biosynthesis (AarF/ABC1/UbiB family)